MTSVSMGVVNIAHLGTATPKKNRRKVSGAISFRRARRDYRTFYVSLQTKGVRMNGDKLTSALFA